MHRRFFSAATVFRVGKRRFLTGKQGAALLCFINRLVSAADKADSVRWLIPYRDQFRVFRRDDQRALLTYVAINTHDANERRLAIWLRGNCGGTMGTPEIFRLYVDANDATRTTIVRTLKKMHAWSELSRIEHTATDSRIRNLARPRPPELLDERLHKFVRNLDGAEPSSSELPNKRLASPRQPRRLPHSSKIRGFESSRFIVADNVDWGGGKPAKPVWLIRQILQRIHLLVRGPNHAQ